MLHASHQVLPPALHRLVNHLRIGEREIGGTDGIQELAQVEDQLALLVFIQPLHLGGRLEQRRGSQQIALFEGVEDRVLLPIRGAEAFIALLRRDYWLVLLTLPPECENS